MKTQFFQALGLGAALLAGCPVRATDETAIPGHGFAASRYESLWTKSPFAVASEEAAPESSDYELVGIAQFDGISYASLIDKQNQEHFLLASDKPVRGLTLTSVTHGIGPSGTFAVVQRNGESLTLKLTAAADAPVAPGAMLPQIPMPGMIPPQSNMPTINLRHRMIHVPPPPGQPQPASTIVAPPPGSP